MGRSERVGLARACAAGDGSKGARRMPRRLVPKKDGANTDMLRGAVRRRGSEDFRMGEPLFRHGKRPAAVRRGGGHRGN